MRKTVFWDASAFIALLLPRDRWHEQAKRVQGELTAVRAKRITTSAVLTEVANGLCAVTQRHLAQRLIWNVDQSVLMGHTEVVHINNKLWWRGFELYQQRPDKAWGLTDCLSFVVMRERGLYEAFTADHHFAQAGFSCLLG